MKTEIILTIDVGTQSIRAVLIDLNGNIVDLVKTEIEAYFSEQPGWAEQDPLYFWDKLCETTKKLFAETEIQKDRIKAVSLTTQRGTLVNTDKDGHPIRPAMIWLDQRRADLNRYPRGWDKFKFAVVNMNEAIIHAIKNAECNWIMQNQPEIWEKTEKFIYLSAWLIFKLTGEFADSVGNMVGYLPFNYKKQDWAAITHRNYKMFPVEGEKLAKLYTPSEIIGEIPKTVSEQTGIPAGLPLVAAASDKATEVLGSGVFKPGVACLSYGTTATVQTTQSKYYEVIPFFPSYPGAIQNSFNTEIMIYRGFWMVNWFKQEFGHREMKIAKKIGKAPEQLFDEMIQEIPPGSMGLTLQPFWSPGVKIPGTEAKGAIIGFGDVHTRAHIYRAILEGLAYALKEGLQRTEKRTKKKVHKIIVSGGGSQSEQAMQLTADIFNLPVEKPHTYETSALGASINAAMGMNYFNSYEEAVSSMCRTGKSYAPDKQNRDIYHDLYNKVYLKMYKRLQGLYHNIREITGYPEKM
jgi:sugar (pentulose or hexulose) kinase